MPTALSWSSGKDSALALHVLRREQPDEVVKLLTTVHGQRQRIALHEVGADLVRAQAEAVGVEVDVVTLPETADNEAYDRAMTRALDRLKAEGIDTVAFGDIALEDVRRYREERMEANDMKTFFPLWGRNTDDLADHIISAGFRAVVVGVDGSVLDRSFLGRAYDEEFLRDLPPGVDPCGENGEFHTFCYDGPIFRHPMPWTPGKIGYRDFPAPATDKDRSGDSPAASLRFRFLEIHP